MRRSQDIVSQSSDRLLGRGFIDSFVALLDCPGTGGTVAAVAAIAGIKKQFRRVAEIDIYPKGYSFKYPRGYSGTKKCRTQSRIGRS